MHEHVFWLCVGYGLGILTGVGAAGLYAVSLALRALRLSWRDVLRR